jgi:hypothetical protein
MRIRLAFCALIIGAASCLANTIVLPGGTLNVPALDTGGVSFIYNGTLTQNDTLAFTESGSPCLQEDPAEYCTNGGGVVTVAGNGAGVGGTSTFVATFNGTTATWNFGALLLEIQGEGTVQLFAADSADGLGSSSPPTSLTLSSSTLASLGFASFSGVDPTITFIVADGPGEYFDNSGSFTLTQATPEPSMAVLLGPALAGLVLLGRRFRSSIRQRVC